MLLAFGFAHAQEFRGTIAGTVTDPNGAVVPAATVTVQNLETNVTADAQTNDEGAFTFPLLLPRRYKVLANQYKSIGAGAKTNERVKWARQLSDDEAAAFRAEYFLKGSDGWNPHQTNFDSQPRAKPDFKLVAWTNVLEQPPLWHAVDEATRIAN